MSKFLRQLLSGGGFILLFLALAWLQAGAAPHTPNVPPPNDTVITAAEIPATGPFPYLAPLVDVSEANTTGDPVPTCLSAGQLARSVWYRFTPNTSTIYRFSTSGADLGTGLSFAPAPTSTSLQDTYIAVFNDDFTNTLVCDNDGGAGFQSETTTPLTANETYYIMVSQWSQGGAPAPDPLYKSVQLYVAPALPTNNSCTAPTELSLGSVVIGTTSDAINSYQTDSTGAWNNGSFATTASGRDVVYSFTAPTTDTYSFRLHNAQDTNDIVQPNPVLYISETCPSVGGNPPITVDFMLGANRTGQRGAAETTLPLQLDANETVYVFVDSDSNLGYGFRLEVNVPIDEATLEPNNTPAEASVYTDSIMGGFANSSDVDFFAVSVPISGSRLFAMADAGGMNSEGVRMRVTTLSDTLEYDSGDNTPPFGGSSGNVAGVPVSSGEVFLRLNHAFGSTAYPYRLFSVVQPPLAQAIIEQEPNDSATTANSNNLNYFFGTLAEPAPSTDRDVYSFQAQAGDTIFVALDGNPTRDDTPLNAQVSLLDDQGNLLYMVNDSNGTASNLPGAGQGSLEASTPNNPGEAFVYKTTQSGTYHVLVTSGSPSAPQGAGDYLLSIRTFPLEAEPNAGQLILLPEFNSVSEAVSTTSVLVQRIGGSDGAISVDIATIDGSALAGQDYEPISDTLTFADGEMSKPISITLIDDSLPESSEIFTVTLSNPQGGASLGTSYTTTFTITDDDVVVQEYQLYLPIIRK